MECLRKCDIILDIRKKRNGVLFYFSLFTTRDRSARLLRASSVSIFRSRPMLRSRRDDGVRFSFQEIRVQQHPESDNIREWRNRVSRLSADISERKRVVYDARPCPDVCPCMQDRAKGCARNTASSSAKTLVNLPFYESRTNCRSARSDEH